MTVRPLAHDFPLMAPPLADGTRLSLRPPHAVPDDEQLIELHDERDRRRTAYPKLIAGGRLDEAEARRHRAILDAIVEDCTPMPANLSHSGWQRWRDARAAVLAACPFTWADKVRELRRELALRRNMWPRHVETGRLPLADARRRMERLEAVHWRYWIRLDFWDEVAPVTEGYRWAWLDAVRIREAAVRAFLWAAHLAGDPAVAGCLTPEQIAWFGEHQQEAA